MSYFGCKPRLRYRSLLPFDLGVAVCAQQYAFPRFLTQLLDGPGHTAKRHLKVLGRGVDVVEVKRSGIAPIPAANTTVPGLFDKELLDTAPTAGHRLRATP